MASSFKRRNQNVSGISVAWRNLNGPKQRHLFAGAGGLVIENRRLMCYKSPWGRGQKSAVRPLSPEGMATACRYQAGLQLSFARRPTKGAIAPQLKIVARTSTLQRPTTLVPVATMQFAQLLGLRIYLR